MPKIRITSIPLRAVLAATAAASFAAAALGGACASAGAASLPPELPPLLAKLNTLQVSSERFSTAVTLRSHKLSKALSGLRSLTIHIDGEATLSDPLSGTITATALGRTTTVRQIGTTLYTEEPAISEHDGGRPWISSTATKQDGILGDDSPGVAEPGSVSYAGVAKLIAKARSVKALGPSSVDAQPVSRFVFTLAPAKLESSFSAKTRRDLSRLHVAPKAKFEVDFAASGLPVHTAGRLSFGRKLSIAITADVLAVDFPLTVTAPPAAETISEAELLALLKSSNGKKHIS